MGEAHSFFLARFDVCHAYSRPKYICTHLRLCLLVLVVVVSVCVALLSNVECIYIFFSIIITKQSKVVCDVLYKTTHFIPYPLSVNISTDDDCAVLLRR